MINVKLNKLNKKYYLNKNKSKSISFKYLNWKNKNSIILKCY